MYPYNVLTVNKNTIASSTGGIINFTLDAGLNNAGRNYILLGSTSGTELGFPLPGGYVTLPLNWDALTNAVLQNLNTYMSIDKITRVVADLCQDSSVVIDSLLTEFQRNFIEIIFGDPIHRPKTLCYVGVDMNSLH